MNDDPELERWRAAFASLAAGSVAGDECPRADDLWAAVRGEAAAERTRELVLHVAGCPACAEAWRMAIELREPAADVPSGAAKPHGWLGWRTWGTLAAAAAVALGLGLLRPGRVEPPQYRGAAPFVVQALVAEDRPQPRSAFLLRWSPGPAGSRYDLRVASEALEPIAHARALESAFFEVPAQALSSLPKGAKLVWQVEAVLPDGSRVVSRTFFARLE